MKTKKYLIRYSVMTEGGEFPNQLTIEGKDQDEVKANLLKKFAHPEDVEITEIVAL